MSVHSGGNYYQVVNGWQRTAYQAKPTEIQICIPVEPPLDSQSSAAASPPQSFSVWSATKETVKGVFRPVGTLVKHPLKSMLALGATAVVASVAPITVPFMVIGGLGFGALQTARGIQTAVSEYSKGNYQASEKAFGNIGEGAFSVAGSLLGIRQAGVIAAESKASYQALQAGTQVADRLKAIDRGLNAAQKVASAPWSHAFRETLGVFSAQGGKALMAQLHPARVSALLKGQVQTWVGLFKDNPVVDVDKAVRKAQRFLHIKDADMPQVVKSQVGSGEINAGAYNTATHSIHIEPDRFKALQSQFKGLKQLPKPLQRFVGNVFKALAPIDELAVHELKHAQQFRKVQCLSVEQTQAAMESRFSQESPERLKGLLNNFRLGQAKPNARHAQQAENYLASQINTHLKTHPWSQESSLVSHRAYYRALHEVEARQAAAESIIANTAGKMHKAKDATKLNHLMQRYRSARWEAKLNKLLGKINRANQKAQSAQAAAYEAALARMSQVLPTHTLTHRYVVAEQQFQVRQQVANAARFMQNQGQQGKVASQGGVSSMVSYIRNTVSSVFGWFKQLFISKGLQQVEQQAFSLRPTYVTVNHIATGYGSTTRR